MRRSATPYKPDNNIEGVVAQDIMDNAIENRHLANNEITPNKIAMVETKVGVPIMIDFEVDADASGGLDIFDADAPFKMEIVDVIVQCRASNALGTLKITDGTNDITDAIVCAVDTTVVRAGTIDVAYSIIATGGSLAVVANGAADRGLVTIIAKKID